MIPRLLIPLLLLIIQSAACIAQSDSKRELKVFSSDSLLNDFTLTTINNNCFEMEKTFMNNRLWQHIYFNKTGDTLYKVMYDSKGNLSGVETFLFSDPNERCFPVFCESTYYHLIKSVEYMEMDKSSIVKMYEIRYSESLKSNASFITDEFTYKKNGNMLRHIRFEYNNEKIVKEIQMK